MRPTATATTAGRSCGLSRNTARMRSGWGPLGWTRTPARVAAPPPIHTSPRGCFTTSPIRHHRVMPGTVTHNITTASARAAGGSRGFQKRSSEELAALPALRCPGGPRIKAEGIKQLYKVPHAGFLAKYDQRFVLNLKLTHQIASHLSRSTLKTDDKVLLELGPGAGSLTRSLLTRPCVGVLGVESDERFNAHLEQIRGYTRGAFQWVNADVLAMDEVAMLRRFFPAFTAMHQRRRPGGDRGGEESADDGAERGGPADASGEADGFDGAPLRSAQRERLLRQRYARHGPASGAPHATAHRQNLSYGKHSYGEDTHADPQHGNATGHSAGAASHTSTNAALGVADRWWAAGDAKVEVVANLPFNIITELLMRYAVDCSRREKLFSFGRVPLHIFTQKEVADRITAPAGSVHFSRLSVLTQAFFHVRVQQVFTEWTYYPRTEVLGAMLTLEPRAVPLGWGAAAHDAASSATATATTAAVDGAALMHFTDLLMRSGHRGSTIHKSLSAFMPAEVVQYVLQASRTDGALTVLDLSVEELVRMAGMWRSFLTASQQQQQQSHP